MESKVEKNSHNILDDEVIVLSDSDEEEYTKTDIKNNRDINEATSEFLSRNGPRTLSRTISNTIPTNNHSYTKNTTNINEIYFKSNAGPYLRYNKNFQTDSEMPENDNFSQQNLEIKKENQSEDSLLETLKTEIFYEDEKNTNSSKDRTVKSKQGLPVAVNGNKFFCKFCSKEFLRKQQLENHLKIHLGVKKFQCSMCGKKFIHKQQLNSHMKTHTGEKNFVCEICLKRFAHKQQLENHTKIHTGQKDFECSSCQKQFTHKQQLQNHVKVHLGIKNFACHLCPKRFTLKQQLVYHVKSHLGQRDFQCAVCDKSFITKQQLECHIKVHSEFGSFVCEICGSNFRSGKELRSHKTEHLKDLHWGEENFDIQSIVATQLKVEYDGS